MTQSLAKLFEVEGLGVNRKVVQSGSNLVAGVQSGIGMCQKKCQRAREVLQCDASVS